MLKFCAATLILCLLSASAVFRTPAIVSATPLVKLPFGTRHSAIGQPDCLVVDRRLRRVFMYSNGVMVISYPIAIGKKNWETPVGRWHIREKIVDPAWTNFITRRAIEPGRSKPLGSRWIGFWNDGKDDIGFHATQNTGSIGKAASHGCIRMFDSDVRDLFDRVAVGMPVYVIN